MKKLIIVLTLSISTIGLCGITYAKNIVTDGLVSYWTFDQGDIVDNTVKDAWGENDATIVGNPIIVNGRVKDALRFDGIKDYVNLTTLGNFGAKLDTSTFEVWIKTDYKDTWTTLFKVRDQGFGFKTGMGWGIDINRTLEDPRNIGLMERVNRALNKEDIGDQLIYGENIILTFLLTFKANIIGRSEYFSIHRFPISDGEWHHIAYVNEPSYFDEDGEEVKVNSLFIDGTLNRISKPKHKHPNKYLPFFEPVYLGAGNNQGQAEGFFNGIIDEVRIYDRPLTEAEIMHNYQSTTGLAVEHKDKLPTVCGALKKR
ncbi:MAG: LamG domain-containing protein [Candidatus Poribacteria bacterium]|nr:LamG domain-containing protein [Candidatus Poribacteria bacterium]